MKASSKNNRVEFILDGDEYFRRLRLLLEEVRDADPSPETYVRMAYWWISPDCNLGGPATGPTLVDTLKAVASQGHQVQVIAWRPNAIDATLEGLAQAESASRDVKIPSGDESAEDDESMLGGILKDHIKLAKDLNSQDNPNITVYLEKYDGWWGASNHQKFAIFAIDGKLKVLLGGLNLANSYYSDETHQNGLWHDTALLMQGECAVDVEKEWARRWEKGYTQLPVVHSQVPIVGPALKNLINRFVGTTCASKREQPVEQDIPVQVDIRTTNSESWFGREADIQARLVEEIGKAQDYIYLENFTLFDPTIVQALYDRMSQSRRPKLIVMVPKPTQDVFSYLTYIAYAKIALASCTSISTQVQTIARSDTSSWQLSQTANDWTTMRAVTSTFSNRWMEDDGLLVTMKGSSSPKLVPVCDLTEIIGGTQFYYSEVADQSIYIHSKLALFDDKVAVVGSANYNFRSQTYDGEISAFVSGNDVVVSAIRKKLFAGYCMTDAQSWDTKLNQVDADVQVKAADLRDYPARSVEQVNSPGMQILNFTLL